jgi:hypothetical protein
MVGTISMDKALAVDISALHTAQGLMTAEVMAVMAAEVMAAEITTNGTRGPKSSGRRPPPGTLSGIGSA